MRLHVFVRTLGIHGGTERFTHGFVRWAVENQHEVTVHNVWTEQAVDGTGNKNIPLHARGRLLKMIELDQRLKKASRQISEPQISMVRGGASPLYRAGGGCHAHWMRSNGWSIADHFELSIDKRVCQHAQRVIVNSARTIALLNQYYGVPSEKCLLLRNGVDTHRFTPTGPIESITRPTMIFIGHNFQRKGLDTVLKWLPRLPDWQLWVLGRDPRQKRFVNLARKLKVCDRINWLGRVDNPEYWLRSASVCVLPTRYDPAANVCLEALASGTPVLTSSENGASELLWEDWMTIERNEEVPIAEILDGVLSSQDALSKTSREVALQNRAEKCYQKLWQICMQYGGPS